MILALPCPISYSPTVCSSVINCGTINGLWGLWDIGEICRIVVREVAVDAHVSIVLELKLLLLLACYRHLLCRWLTAWILARVKFSTELFRLQAFFSISTWSWLNATFTFSHSILLWFFKFTTIDSIWHSCWTLIWIASPLNLVGWPSFFFVHNALLCLISLFFVTTASRSRLVLKVRVLALLILRKEMLAQPLLCLLRREDGLKLSDCLSHLRFVWRVV